MSLTFGRGPFSAGRGAFDVEIPEQVGYVEDWPRRMRAVVAGQTILDSRRGKLLHRSGAFPAWLFPLEDLRHDLLAEIEPGHWTVRVGDRSVVGAVTAAPDLDGAAGTQLRGMVEFDYAAADRWFEEDDPIYSHPRDPFHRVDVRSSSRHVTVRHGGQLLAESRRPKLLFETSLPVRYYLPFADVRTEVLQRSDTMSECPYKGDGQYWHLITGNADRVEDAGWSLPHPLPEGIAAAEHICFDPGKVELTVDGEPITT